MIVLVHTGDIKCPECYYVFSTSFTSDVGIKTECPNCFAPIVIDKTELPIDVQKYLRKQGRHLSPPPSKKLLKGILRTHPREPRTIHFKSIMCGMTMCGRWVVDYHDLQCINELRGCISEVTCKTCLVKMENIFAPEEDS